MPGVCAARILKTKPPIGPYLFSTRAPIYHHFCASPVPVKYTHRATTTVTENKLPESHLLQKYITVLTSMSSLDVLCCCSCEHGINLIVQLLELWSLLLPRLIFDEVDSGRWDIKRLGKMWLLKCWMLNISCEMPAWLSAVSLSAAVCTVPM